MVTTLDGRQMRWKCRRGMLELDYLLQSYFDRCYATLSEEQKTLFSNLLDATDVELYQWLTHKSVPQRAEFEALVRQILSASREVK